MIKSLCLFLNVFFLVFLCQTCQATNQTIPEEGLVAEGKKEWQKALDIYLTILIKEPKRIDLWLRVADIEHHLKQDTLTIAAYEHALAVEPQNPRLHKKLSEIYAGLNQPHEALQHIELAVKYDPDHPEYLESWAKISNWNKKPEIALKSDKKLLSMTNKTTHHEKYLFLLLQIAQLQQELKDYDGATLTYQDILKINPNNKIAQKWLENTVAKKQVTLNQSKPVSLFEQSVNAANDLAMAHHYQTAIKTLKQASKLEKHAWLYKKISELYAMSQQPKPALFYINKALQIEPNNIPYLKAKGRLASWAGQRPEALSAYQHILSLSPNDEEAMLQYAHTLATIGKTDQALIAYDKLLRCYPNNAVGWLYFAEALTWVEQYPKSIIALEHYQKLKGKDIAYQKILARIHALDGFYKTSLCINEPILKKNPKETYALMTEVIALKKAYQLDNAMFFLRQLNRWSSPDKPLRQFNTLMRTPLRANVNAGADYTWATDTTGIIDVPVGAQYFISPTTSLLAQGLYERLTANIRSGLGTIQGKGAIFDESARLGFSTQLLGMNLTALVGDLQIQQGSNFGIYDVSLDTNLNENIAISFDSLHDLFRPYLVPQTPRSVSLEIMEQRTSMFVQWQPFIQKYLYLLSSYSTLSDHNNYWHINAWPKARVFGSQQWLINLGMDADIWTFARRANDGYFSPRFFQEYESTVEIYHGFTENIGVSLAGGFGIQKDEILSHFYYAEDLNARLIYGIVDNYQLQLKGGYTLRANPIKNYQCRIVSLVLTKRF